MHVWQREVLAEGTLAGMVGTCYKSSSLPKPLNFGQDVFGDFGVVVVVGFFFWGGGGLGTQLEFYSIEFIHYEWGKIHGWKDLVMAFSLDGLKR